MEKTVCVCCFGLRADDPPFAQTRLRSDTRSVAEASANLNDANFARDLLP